MLKNRVFNVKFLNIKDPGFKQLGPPIKVNLEFRITNCGDLNWFRGVALAAPFLSIIITDRSCSLIK